MKSPVDVLESTSEVLEHHVDDSESPTNFLESLVDEMENVEAPDEFVVDIDMEISNISGFPASHLSLEENGMKEINQRYSTRRANKQ